MEFDKSKLFSGTCGIGASVKPMSHPFLITHAFDDRRQSEVYVPDALRVVLAKCCERMADEIAKPDHLRDMLMRGLKAYAGEAGLLGLDNLPLDELFDGRSDVSMVIGMTGTKIRLRRYGDCLAIRPINEQDEPHEKMMSILTRLAEDGQSYVRHFIQRYGFILTPDLKERSGACVLDAEQELDVMNHYLPDIRWFGNKRIAADLGADFTSHQRAGVKVGEYGDANIFARIVYEREVNDADWRQGKVRNTTMTELAFGAGAGEKPQIEYSIRTIDHDQSWDPAPMGIDYQREQGLLHDLARMLYAGLYQRGFQSRVKNGNDHWVRFRRVPVKAAV